MNYLSLFEGYGIELEYMIVDRDTLAIRPIADELLKAAAGVQVSDFEDGDITWSNELVLHVIELKTSGPAKSLANLERSFHRSLNKASELLKVHNACLLPTAMHPFMQPTEMKLWPHDNTEIYDLYNRIFDCRGHGWSNLQSMHINLPFKTDEEFERLHTSIRFLLPILPALTASSPIVEGKPSGNADSRLVFYQQNQKRVPSIAGQVIPELTHSMADYKTKILDRIYSDITPHDPDELLRDDWLNSRGAIARFGRQTIEIRVLDLQEAPAFDLALADLVVTLLKSLTQGHLVPLETQRKFATESLKTQFDAAAKSAELATLTDPAYSQAWNHDGNLQSLWQSILQRLEPAAFMSQEHAALSKRIIDAGSLATRITRATKQNDIKQVFKKLASCAINNEMFNP